MSSPVHQFEIKSVFQENFVIGGIDLSFTNSALWMAFAAISTIIFLSISMKKKALIPTRAQAFSEIFYEFVAGMIRENIGNDGRKYFPFVFTVFIMVLLGNIFGLLPYSFTYTSHIAVTGALALLIFVVVLLFGFAKHGFHFFSLFVPAGVPVALLPLIIPIEIISFLIRPVTLSVRLFANMVAGHIMLKVFAGFSATMIGIGALGALGALGPMLFNSVLIGFELLIACLQAYVFAVLTCIYLKDTVEIAH